MKKGSFLKNCKKSCKKLFCNSDHMHLMGLVILVAGFSLYAIGSFFSSTNDRLDSSYASVVNDADVVAFNPDQWPGYTGTLSNEPYEIFSDVLSNHEYALAIEALRDMGIISGYEDGSFKPAQKVNRAELLTVLTTALDSDFAGGTYGDCFSDVADEWFSVFVCYAKDEGWVSGYIDGSYQPGQKITRAAALKIILEAFEYEMPETLDEVSFDDVDIDSWYAGYAYVAKNHGVVSAAKNFNAGDKVSRAELVQMIYNVMSDLDLL